MATTAQARVLQLRKATLTVMLMDRRSVAATVVRGTPPTTLDPGAALASMPLPWKAGTSRPPVVSAYTTSVTSTRTGSPSSRYSDWPSKSHTHAAARPSLGGSLRLQHAHAHARTHVCDQTGNRSRQHSSPKIWARKTARLARHLTAPIQARGTHPVPANTHHDTPSSAIQARDGLGPRPT